MSKTNYDISKQMHHDLIEAYKQVYSHCWTQHEAYEKMVKQPAPRYYVTPKQAYQVISPMMKGDFERVDLMAPTRRNLYYSLFEQVIRLSETREFIGKSLFYIMQYAVIQPAPEFFLSPTRARIIRYWVKSGAIKDGRVQEDKIPSYVTSREKRRNHKNRKWTLERMLEEQKEQ